MTTLDAIQATARIATLPMKDRDHNVPRAIDTTVAINVPRMLRALRAVEAITGRLSRNLEAQTEDHDGGDYALFGLAREIENAITEALG